MKEQIKDISGALRQTATLVNSLQQQVEAQKKEIQQMRKWIEKLAAVSGLEWSQDADDWRSKKALDALRKNG